MTSFKSSPKIVKISVYKLEIDQRVVINRNLVNDRVNYDLAFNFIVSANTSHVFCFMVNDFSMHRENVAEKRYCIQTIFFGKVTLISSIIILSNVKCSMIIFCLKNQEVFLYRKS